MDLKSSLRFEKLSDLQTERTGVLQLALPHDEVLPSEFLQRSLIAKIAQAILAEFRLPKLEARFRQPAAFRMPMPEAAVNEDNFLPSRKNDVRPAGKIPTVQAVTETEPPEEPSDPPFRFGVLGPDPAHPLASFERGQGVHGASRSNPSRIIESVAACNRL
jgi:hypothetical protein